jgi:hypothetical protein
MKKKSQTAMNRLPKLVHCFIALMVISLSGFSQNVAINATLNPANPSAGLDVDFANLGLLIPRVALTSTTGFAPLSAHVAGMMVFNTATAGDVVPAFYINDGTKWIPCESTGNSTGDMLYWNGTTWSVIPGGQPGQLLQLSSTNVPLWVGAGYASLTTQAVTAITAATATCGGNITVDGGFAVTVRGVCWNTLPNPTTALSTKTTDGSGTGSFTSSLTGLTSGTSYYVRAYATNTTGTVYGNQVRFVTP